MPLPRKPDPHRNGTLDHAVARLEAVPPRRYPGRVVLFLVVRDESGSMLPWRGKQGSFVPGLLTALREAGGPRVEGLDYVFYAVVSGEVTTSGFSPLKQATDPPFEQDHRITERLKEGAKLLGLRFVDHLIVNRTGCYSFAGNGRW